MVDVEIHDLRERRHHADAVAERIWAAFWRHRGTPLSTIRDGLEIILRNQRNVPFALVAECDGTVCGNALVILNDLAVRANLAPWLAALWVDEPMRHRGLATTLLDEGVRRTGALGIERIYLNSRAALQGFYTGLGWTIVEENVGPDSLTVYARQTSSSG